MIVCLCKGVGCGTVRRSIAEGALTVEAIGVACGAGTDCGGCRGCIEEILEQERPASDASRRGLPVVRAA